MSIWRLVNDKERIVILEDEKPRAHAYFTEDAERIVQALSTSAVPDLVQALEEVRGILKEKKIYLASWEQRCDFALDKASKGNVQEVNIFEYGSRVVLSEKKGYEGEVPPEGAIGAVFDTLCDPYDGHIHVHVKWEGWESHANPSWWDAGMLSPAPPPKPVGDLSRYHFHDEKYA